MFKPNLFGSGQRRAFIRCLLLIAPTILLPTGSCIAQDHDEDHDHLHFSHPLVTESPTPDTKIRLDFIAFRVSGDFPASLNAVRLEGEYAFTHALSLAVVTPFVWITEPATDRASGFGDVELALKAASLAFADRGFLVGGGLSTSLPTGSDSKGIGSSHIVEVEPFVDVGYKRDALELVGFARVSSTFRRQAGEEQERNLAFDFSSLYHISPRLEGLFELTTTRALVGPERGVPQTFVAPGVKIYPFANRQIMFGASVELGTGAITDARGYLLSGFYHF